MYNAMDGYYEWHPCILTEKNNYESEARSEGNEYILWTEDIDEAINKTNELNENLIRYAVIVNFSANEVDYVPFYPWETFDKIGGRYWSVDEDSIFTSAEEAEKAVELLRATTL